MSQTEERIENGWQYTGTPQTEVSTKDCRIFLVGFMGAGKSHWGQRMAPLLGLPFFDLDTLLEEEAGMTVSQIFATKGEEFFRKLERETLHDVTETHDAFVMACGGGTPCFHNNIGYMNSRGATLWLNTSLPVLQQRLQGEAAKRPLISGIRPDQLQAFVQRKWGDRRLFYEQADHHLAEDHLTLDQLVHIAQSATCTKPS